MCHSTFEIFAFILVPMTHCRQSVMPCSLKKAYTNSGGDPSLCFRILCHVNFPQTQIYRVPQVSINQMMSVATRYSRRLCTDADWWDILKMYETTLSVEEVAYYWVHLKLMVIGQTGPPENLSYLSSINRQIGFFKRPLFIWRNQQHMTGRCEENGITWEKKC